MPAALFLLWNIAAYSGFPENLPAAQQAYYPHGKQNRNGRPCDPGERAAGRIGGPVDGNKAGNLHQRYYKGIESYIAHEGVHSGAGKYFHQKAPRNVFAEIVAEYEQKNAYRAGRKAVGYRTRHLCYPALYRYHCSSANEQKRGDEEKFEILGQVPACDIKEDGKGGCRNDYYKECAQIHIKCVAEPDDSEQRQGEKEMGGLSADIVVNVSLLYPFI